MSTQEDIIDVVAAVVRDDDRYLCVQRRRSHRAYNSEHWEFPGGKVKAGESRHEALLREIREEMDWDVYVGRPLGCVVHAYPDFTIRLWPYLCKSGDGPFTLLEHLDARWLTREEAEGLNWTAADRQVLALLP